MVPGKKLLNESGGFHYFLDHIYYTVELTVIKIEISPLCTTKIPWSEGLQKVIAVENWIECPL